VIEEHRAEDSRAFSRKLSSIDPRLVQSLHIADLDPLEALQGEHRLARKIAVHQRDIQHLILFEFPPELLRVGRFDAVVKLVSKDRKSTRLNSSHVKISYA